MCPCRQTLLPICGICTKGSFLQPEGAEIWALGTAPALVTLAPVIPPGAHLRLCGNQASPWLAHSPSQCAPPVFSPGQRRPTAVASQSPGAESLAQLSRRGVTLSGVSPPGSPGTAGWLDPTRHRSTRRRTAHSCSISLHFAARGRHFLPPTAPEKSGRPSLQPRQNPSLHVPTPLTSCARMDPGTPTPQRHGAGEAMFVPDSLMQGEQHRTEGVAQWPLGIVASGRRWRSLWLWSV